MNRTPILATVSILILCANARAADPGQPPLPGAAPPADAPFSIESLTREAEPVISAVLEQHVDPPTRQEMWLAGTKALLANAGAPARGSLSSEISRVTTADQFAALLKDVWSSTGHKSRAGAPAFTEAFISGILEIVPGGADLTADRQFRIDEQIRGNRYVGTGIALGFDSEKKYPQIAQVIPGGPMEHAGGKTGDLILKIDDREMHGTKITDTVELLRGEAGSRVTLVVRPSGENADLRTLVVTRGPVIFATLKGLAADDYRVAPDSPIRYINVLQINGSTAHDLRRLEPRFRADGARAVILDLREVDGEELHHALLLADALMDGGLIGRMRTRHRLEEFRADRERVFRDLPLAVLVNERTDGGGEWVAAALQDNRAAIIVGAPTAGSAWVSTNVALPGSAGVLRLCTGVFERPSGHPLQRPRELAERQVVVSADRQNWGVKPDIRVAAAHTAESGRSGTRRTARERADNDAQTERGTDPVLAAAIKELHARIEDANGRKDK